MRESYGSYLLQSKHMHCVLPGIRGSPLALALSITGLVLWELYWMQFPDNNEWVRVCGRTAPRAARRTIISIALSQWKSKGLLPKRRCVVMGWMIMTTKDLSTLHSKPGTPYTMGLLDKGSRMIVAPQDLRTRILFGYERKVISYSVIRNATSLARMVSCN